MKKLFTLVLLVLVSAVFALSPSLAFAKSCNTSGKAKGHSNAMSHGKGQKKGLKKQAAAAPAAPTTPEAPVTAPVTQ